MIDQDGFRRHLIEVVETLTSKKYYSMFQKQFVDLIKKIIKDRKMESKTKFLALYLLKIGLETKEIYIIGYTKSKILKRLGILGSFKDSHSGERRGRMLFGSAVGKYNQNQ